MEIYFNLFLTSRKDDELRSDDIEVNQIESFQGREKDVIIISALKPVNGFASFHTRTHLLIALSRAKHVLIFCGNFVQLDETNSTHCELLAVVEDAKKRRRFLNVTHPQDVKNIIAKLKKNECE